MSDKMDKTAHRMTGSDPLLDCDRRFKALETDINRIDNALFGPDGTDGIVAKINKIEMQTGFMRYIGQSAFGIAVSVITLLIVKALGL